MTNIADTVDAYIAVWNEADPGFRRQQIEAIWIPDGTSRHRLLDCRGYDAIEQRVTQSWHKWLSESQYRFRLKSFTHHHDAIMVEFAMIKLPGENVAANGLSFLLLDADGRIRHDYQFSPSTDDAQELAERYVAILNASDDATRQSLVAKAWTADCRFVGPRTEATGLGDVADEFARLNAGARSTSQIFASAHLSQEHHGLARIAWQLQTPDGRVVTAATDLLVLNEAGQIEADYQFSRPVSRS